MELFVERRDRRKWNNRALAQFFYFLCYLFVIDITRCSNNVFLCAPPMFFARLSFNVCGLCSASPIKNVGKSCSYLNSPAPLCQILINAFGMHFLRCYASAGLNYNNSESPLYLVYASEAPDLVPTVFLYFINSQCCNARFVSQCCLYKRRATPWGAVARQKNLVTILSKSRAVRKGPQ